MPTDPIVSFGQQTRKSGGAQFLELLDLRSSQITFDGMKQRREGFPSPWGSCGSCLRFPGVDASGPCETASTVDIMRNQQDELEFRTIAPAEAEALRFQKDLHIARISAICARFFHMTTFLLSMLPASTAPPLPGESVVEDSRHRRKC